MNKTVVVGPQGRPGRRVGGVTVLFDNLLEEMEASGKEILVIDTYKPPGFDKLISVFKIFVKAFSAVPNSRMVVLNATAQDVVYLGPLFLLLTKIFRSRLVVRKFAGNFDSYVEGSRGLVRLSINMMLKYSDCWYFETKRLVNWFEPRCRKVGWFPNIRRRTAAKRNITCFRNSFVFIGQVKTSKGVLDAIECFKNSSLARTLDIFGPLEMQLPPLPDAVRYRGELPAVEVQEKLSKYDCLVLPTVHPGEGYPGVILEAMMVGVPVVASAWGGIPEIVMEGVNGRLVPPGDVSALCRALSLDRNEVRVLSEGAYLAGFSFESEAVTRRFMSELGLNDIA